MSDYAALCVTCRSLFTEAEIATANSCPTCGSESIPADPNKTATITLTHHEWRLLCIWAHNYGEGLKSSFNPINSIVGEMHKQAELPPLTMMEEFKEIKAEFPGARLIKPEDDGLHREGR